MNPESRNALLRRCRERFTDVLLKVVGEAGIRLPELLQALSDSSVATFDELAGLKGRKDFERQRSMTASRISLVHLDDMDLTVAMINLAQKLTDRCERSLSQVHLRFMTLLEQDDAVMAQLPIGPDAACAALRGMLDTGVLDMPTRLGLPASIEPALGQALSALYGELDTLLEQAGVQTLSLLRPASERGATGINSAGSGTAETVAMAGGTVGALQQALQRRTVNSGRSAGPSLDPGLAAAIAERVLVWLSERQQDQIAAAQLNTAELNLLLPASASAGLDALGMSLDALLEDARLCPTLRSAISVLRIPLFKAALIAPECMTDDTHPVRRCLESLLGLAFCIDPASTGAHPMVAAISMHCRQCAREFDRDLAIFDNLRVEIDALQARHTAAAAARASTLATATAEREARRELGRRRAAQAIRALLAESVPEPLHDFLEQFWVRVLAAVHLMHGEKSAQWTQALSTANRLIWSMQPKVDQAARSELVAALPGLIEDVKQGLDLIGVSEKLREHLMQRFVAFHSAALHGRSHDDGATHPVPPAVPARIDIPNNQPGLRLVRLPPDAEGEPRVPDWIEALAVDDWLDISLPEEHAAQGGRMRIAWVGGAARVYLVTHPDKDSALIFPLRWLIQQYRDGAAGPVKTRGVLEAAAEAALKKI